MRAVDFGVTHRAIAIEGIAKIMEGRRNASQHLAVSSIDGQCNVTFQALLGDIATRQHSRIHRAVRLMTSRAGFRTNRRVFIAERPALVGMALQTTRLIAAVA